jgi:hypothetical protein
MSICRILMTTAALAMLTPLIAATPSFAEGRGFLRSTAAGVAASPRGVANVAAGGGVHVGGGGGWNHVGGGGGGWNHVGGGGGWNRGGVAMGNGGGNWNRGSVAVGNGGGGWNHGGGGGGWHHGGHHGGFFPGAVAGAVIGGALASSAYASGPYYNNYDYGYYDQPDYYDQGPVVAVAPDDGDSAGYCAQRFRSYDPGSGTYLGYDGLRHPCP